MGKHLNYLGRDSAGVPHYTALVCGHVVRHPETKVCRECPHLRTRRKRKGVDSRYIRVDANGQSIYRGECGHEVYGNRTRRCRSCWMASSKGYKKTMRDGKSVGIHTLVAERALGRRLKPNEVVHHINLDKSDYRNCNLLICAREYHQALHHAMERAYGQLCCPPLPS